MAAQFDLDTGQEKGAVTLGTSSPDMTATDVRLQVKTGTTREQVLLGLRKLEQFVQENDSWIGT